MFSQRFGVPIKRKLKTIKGKLEDPRSGVAIYATADMPFFACLVKYFPAILGCSDCLYDRYSLYQQN